MGLLDGLFKLAWMSENRYCVESDVPLCNILAFIDEVTKQMR